MKKQLLAWLACPHCQANLEIARVDEQRGNQIIRGALRCRDGCAEYPIVNSIPRFVPEHNFADSFGYQWNRFSHTQLDEKLGFDLSEDRFFRETRWPRELRGELVLEAGSGMGRFTRCAASTGAEVISFDYSNAVDANYQNNSKFENVHFLQADIFNMPFRKNIFDRIFCFGVLQHTPDPKRAFMRLLPFGKPGAHLAVDVYRKSWKTLFWGQYYLRVVTRKIPPARLFPIVERYFSVVYSLTGRVRPINDHLSKILAILLGTADYRGELPMPDEKMRELCLLDTFDKLSPAYDNPQTLNEVRNWLAEANLALAEAIPGFNGIEARGQIPQST